MFTNRHTRSLTDLLRRTGPFNECDRRDLRRIAGLVTLVEVPAQRELMYQGAIGQECFVVVHGRVRVERDGAPIATIDDGQIVGELALIDDSPRTGTVTTTDRTTLFVMSQREFASLRRLEIPPVQRYYDAVAEARRQLLRPGPHGAGGAPAPVLVA